MKNFVIAVLFLVVVALGFYIYSNQNNSGTPLALQLNNLFEKFRSKIDEGVISQPDSQEDKLPELLKNLPADTAIAFHFPYQSVKPAVDHIKVIFQKIKNSSLGKKFDFEQQLKDGIQSATGTDPAALTFNAGDASAPQNQQLDFEQSIKIIESFKSIDFSASAGKTDGKISPEINLEARFSDPTVSNYVEASLENLISAPAGIAPISVRKDSNNQNSYILESNPALSPVKLQGEIKNQTGLFSLKLKQAGTPDSSIADATEKYDGNILRDTVLSGNAFVSYFQTANFFSLLDWVLANNPKSSDSAEAASAIESIKSFFPNYQSLASSAQFDNGFRSRSCTSMPTESKLLDIYKEAIRQRSTSSNLFSRLIQPRTTLALNLNGSSMISYLEGMLSGLPGSVPQAKQDQQMRESTAKIEILINKLKQMGLKEIGLLANAPVTSFTPDYAIFIEHSGSLNIQSFADILNQLTAEIAPPSLGLSQQATVSTDSQGRQFINFTLAGSYPLVIKAVSDNIFIGAGQETFLSELSNQLNGTTNYISEEKLASKNIKASLKNNDYQIFFSPSSLIALARQLLPFLSLTMPDLKINDSEVNEILNFFDFNLLLTSSSSLPDESTVCAEGLAVIF